MYTLHPPTRTSKGTGMLRQDRTGEKCGTKMHIHLNCFCANYTYGHALVEAKKMQESLQSISHNKQLEHDKSKSYFIIIVIIRHDALCVVLVMAADKADANQCQRLYLCSTGSHLRGSRLLLVCVCFFSSYFCAALCLSLLIWERNWLREAGRKRSGAVTAG